MASFRSDNGTPASASPSSLTQPPTCSSSIPYDDSLITILHDQVNYNVKHPLQYPWRFSFKTNTTAMLPNNSEICSKEAWEQAVQESTTVQTIEDFWSM